MFSVSLFLFYLVGLLHGSQIPEFGATLRRFLHWFAPLPTLAALLMPHFLILKAPTSVKAGSIELEMHQFLTWCFEDSKHHREPLSNARKCIPVPGRVRVLLLIFWARVQVNNRRTHYCVPQQNLNKTKSILCAIFDRLYFQHRFMFSIHIINPFSSRSVGFLTP